MNKFMFNVSIYEGNPKVKYDCSICRANDKGVAGAYFRFYDRVEEQVETYNFEVCKKCFKNRIKDKPLDDLKYIIALVKLRDVKGTTFSGPFEEFSEDFFKSVVESEGYIYSVYAGKPREYYEGVK